MKRTNRKTITTPTTRVQLGQAELATVAGGATFGEICLEIWDEWTEKWTGIHGGMSQVNSALSGGN